MNTISGVYKITNTVTGDFYIGSSKNVKSRWTDHKKPSVWKKCSNNPMYQDMQKYGVDKFRIQILAEAEVEQLKEKEQKFIELLKPTYNNRNANGWDVERRKEWQKEYRQSEKFKEYQKEYRQSEKFKEYQKEYMKEYQKEYQKSDKYKEYQKEFYKEYNNQLCCYNGELLKLCALSKRFQRASIPHPNIEAKKYLIKR